MSREIQRIVIVGPTEVAAAACACAISLRGSGLDIVFLALPDDEAASPFVLSRGGPHGFHRLLGLDETDIVAKTGGTYQLGTRYRGFLGHESDVTVPLGDHGKPLRLVDFHQYVAKLRAAGEDVALNEFSLPAAAARTGSFDPATKVSGDAARTLGYDLCLERKRYAATMTRFATGLGVSVLRGAVTGINVADGLVESLALESGENISGDFFIDCSGSRVIASRLVPESGFRDWSKWLPCDRAARVAVSAPGAPGMLATVDADDYGWTQRTGLDDHLVHTYAYASEFVGDDCVQQRLARRAAVSEPSDIAIETLQPGRQSEHWAGNCVALGPAAATFEPLDVSPLHLLQEGLFRLLAMLTRLKRSPGLAAEFNRGTNAQLDEIRDYEALRYALADRTEGPFWERVATLDWPESLRRRIALFRTHGRYTKGESNLFDKAHWIASFMNFGCKAGSYDPIADMIDAGRMRADVDRFRAEVAAAADRQPPPGPGISQKR
jgi:tryptophan halogenase